jgi:ribosomal protein L11 methyltransferase
MFVWRKRASTVWLAANEAALREIGGQRLAIISRPDRKTAIAEIAGSRQRDLEEIRGRFGGTIEKLPRDWLARFSKAAAIEPIRIGKRLIIYRSVTSKNKSRNETKSLLIPAGRAFGTGEHATTAMSLRLLERCTRFWGAQAASLRSPEPERTLLDLGTGSGILALAAARFGARSVIAIDRDPVAIATARANARRNKIDNIDFRVADVRRWPFPPRIEIITANLFSELLIEILPKLKRTQRLILSGILRDQEARLVRALKRNGIVIVEMRRRGKWIAILARGWRAQPVHRIGHSVRCIEGSSAGRGAERTGLRATPG